MLWLVPAYAQVGAVQRIPAQIDATPDRLAMDAPGRIPAGVGSLLDDSGLPLPESPAGAHPNPFIPVTTVRYAVPQTGWVRVAVYDMPGRQIQVLVDGLMADGTHEVTFDGGGLPGGTYVYRVETPTAIETYTILLLK
ncbi:MAG: T9SS type A sorting domain-containing protein [Rhodothermales bacterium]